MIDAVVATRDSRDLVLECVDRLRSPLLDRVIVVDNGSVDGTAEALRRARPEVLLVCTDRPEALSFAYNRGAEAGAAEFVLFLNDDVFATEDAIAVLWSGLVTEGPGRCRSRGPVRRMRDGRTQESVSSPRFPRSVLIVPRRCVIGGREGGPEFVATGSWLWTSRPGACLLVRRKLFDAVGGWDEDYEFWFEDVDLARRLVSSGEILFVPGAPFPHVGGRAQRD